MGNCLKPEFSSTVWAGDDWCSIDLWHHGDGCSPTRNMQRQKKPIYDVKEMLSSSSSLCSHSPTREVKIRMSKRQLEQLLDRGERLGLRSEQVVDRLMHAKERRERKHMQQSWSPNLDSIPEMN